MDSFIFTILSNSSLSKTTDEQNKCYTKAYKKTAKIDIPTVPAKQVLNNDIQAENKTENRGKK